MIEYKGYRLLINDADNGFEVVVVRTGMNSFVIPSNLNYFQTITKAKSVVDSLE